MLEGPLEVGSIERSQCSNPANVQSFEKSEGHLDGCILRFLELGPAIFHVGPDHGRLFGQRQLETYVGIHVAVGNVVRDLSNCPAAVAIGRVELRIAETIDGAS